MQEEKACKDDMIIAKNRLLEATKSEMSKKDKSFVSLHQKCGSLQTELETVQGKIQSLKVSGFSYQWPESRGG